MSDAVILGRPTSARSRRPMAPREAATSAAGRGRLVDWLKHHENHAAKAADPLASYDLGCVWQELGVALMRA